MPRLVASVVVALIAMEAHARGERAIEIAGGLALPVGMTTWRDDAGAGWKIGGRGTSDASGPLLVVGAEFARIPHAWCHSFDRYRIMAGVARWWDLAPIAVSARIMAGVDGVSCVHTVGFAPVPFDERVFVIGIGAEAAATVWFVQGVVDVGVEVGVPLALHGNRGGSEGPSFEYLGIDLDVLLAFRVRQRSLRE